jgi:preprotein translocase subunit SecA
MLDTFFSGLRDSDEPRKPQQILEELQALVHLPVKLDANQQRALASDPESLKDEIGEMVSEQLIDLSVTRLVGAVENRLGESLGIAKNDIAELKWDDLGALVAERSKAVLARQSDRLVGSGGQIARDADALIQREAPTNDGARLRLMLSLSQGVRNIFDARTHRPVKQVYQRFGYSFLAAEMLENRDVEDLIEEILVHLEEAESGLATLWGRDELMRRGEPVDGSDETKARETGLKFLNEAHRGLLLSAITELWVDYLTRIEALRVSIGLEAYAQRDPLVQYKSRASEMFQTLLDDIRAAVIGRLFAHQRRPTIMVLEEATQEQVPAGQDDSAAAGANKQKRKRH